MDELIQEIVAKTGVSQAQVGQIIPMVLDFLKSKLPPGTIDQVSGLLGSAGASLGSASQGAATAATDAAGNLGHQGQDLSSKVTGMFGGNDKP